MLKKVVRKHPNDTDCFVCGVNNASGLKTFFYELEDGTLAALVTPKSIHQSYPGRVHGGVISAMLDETIGRAINISEPDTWGVTGELKVRYKKPVPYDEQLTVTGRIVKSNRFLFDGTGEIILSDGTVAATAEGRYVKMPIDKIADFDLSGDKWCVRPDENDPEYIDVP